MEPGAGEVEVMEAGPAASSSVPQLSKQRHFWRLRRRRRIERLPQSMLISTAAAVCLAGLAEVGTFASWRTADPARGLAELSAGFGPGRSSSSMGLLPAGAGFSSAPGRQLQGAYVYDGINLTDIVCPASINSSSIFSALSFEDDKGAATVFLVAVTLYMFLGLAIVCDSFFEAALSAICDKMNLKEDVAGATWMAAGGSAPEFATSTIGVFFSFSDVGFGTIVGSAVFNVLFVIAACAFVSNKPLDLSWWPLARDCSYYCFSLAMLVIFVSDLKVEGYEAVILFLMYIGYVTIMYFNEALEEWVKKQVVVQEARQNLPNKIYKDMIILFENKFFSIILYLVILTNSVVVIAELVEFNDRSADLPCICSVSLGAATLPYSTLYYVNLAFNIFFILEMGCKLFAYGPLGYWKVPLNAFDGSLVFLIIVEIILTEQARSSASGDSDPTAEANDQIGVGAARTLRLLKFVRFIRTLRLIRGIRIGVDAETKGEDTPDVRAAKPALDDQAKTRVDVEGSNGDAKPPPATTTVDEPAEPEEEEDDDGPFDPFEMPDSPMGKFFWAVGLPLAISFWLTIPDCRRDMFENYWIFTFSNCIAWIAILSGVMVWMVERLGVIYGVPDSIMGIFVLAAGTSIPDCLSSVAVARRGHGDMAVSSSIGSNIFDVLIGLPVPWMIYTLIIRPALGPEHRFTQPDTFVRINSEGLAFMILLLFVMVALVITTIHLSGWTLSKRLGMAMMGLYFVFLVIALLVDRKVFFPDCKSNLDSFLVYPPPPPPIG